MRAQAWITSAVEDKIVDKAILLSRSLRRLRTTKKLVVFTTKAVSKHLRENLKETFDLVILLDQDFPNGLSLEDYAKVQAFSLMLFNKCVYLSPNTVVLKNCDEMFEKYSNFATCKTGDDTFDSSVYVFKPSLDKTRAFEKLVHSVDLVCGKPQSFHDYFNLWISTIPSLQMLDDTFNSMIDLGNHYDKSYNNLSMEMDISIANFINDHPLDFPHEKLMQKVPELGFLERFAVERCLQIYANGAEPSIHDGLMMIEDQHENEPIAIVGMSFRLPGSNNVDEFWDLLVNGREAIVPVPPFRWTTEHTTIPCKDRKFEAGFLTVPVDEFDAKFFGLSPKEAVFLDPQQRFLHEVSWEALEDAMIDPHKIHGTQTGVFVGSWIYDYKDIAVRSSDVDFFRVYMGTSLASEASRLSHFYGTTGPSIATESGCSSAIVALHMACKSLRNGESSLALACGVNLLLQPQDQSMLDFVVAADGRCKTFDANADGFGRAEGCAVLVLKRYSDALKDENKIWGLIRGTAVTQEGVSKSIGTPTVHCESLAMELALKDAGVDPTDVDYIEAHGTGTSVGDPMEMSAITKAYSKKGRNKPLIIGSVKTNVGHTESVSGLTGIIKVLLSMKHDTIPKHLNLNTINPEINLDAIPAQIPLSTMSWPRHDRKPKMAGVSSFGISGTDGHAIVQEAPVILKERVNFHQERPLHIMKITAKCQESLNELLRKYETQFSEKAKTDSEQDFADMAYSSNFGRATFNHRAVLVAKNFSEAVKSIREKTYKHVDVQSTGSQLCFLFTGQGSQYPNMAKNLCSTSPVFKFHFDKCSDVLQKRYGISIKDVLWGDSNNGGELSRTLYSQTSIFCVEYCLLKLWESWGVKPDFVMGHSLGEFAAAVAAGALSFEDALMLVAERSRLIDNLPRGKMLVIKADKSTVDSTIAKYRESHPDFWVDYAALNSPDQTVVAGDSTEIDGFANYCDETKLKSIVLASTHAFHSRHMDPMLEAYRKIAMKVKRPTGVNEDAPKYSSGMEGSLIDIKSINADYWVRHTRERVNFIDACKVIEKEGCNLFLEVGPHPVLSALVMANFEGHSVTCLPSLRRNQDEWVILLESLSKLYLSEWKGEIDWKRFDCCYDRRRVSLPFYQFNRKSIWCKTRPVLGELHPLLGRVIPNASGSSVFEQDLTLKKADFAQDHVIGNTIVFPGAGFLEMCLVGGHACVQGFGGTFMHPRRPVLLKGLKVKDPLAILDSQMCILQTVAVLDESDEEEMAYSVNIFRVDLKDSAAGGQWISHASAKFFPVVPCFPREISKFNIAEAQESWEKLDSKDFYEKLPEVGLRFGPKFQSLQGGWKQDTGVLLQVKAPSDTEPYVIHPVVGDAMIQAAMLWTSKDKIKRKLQVPVHVDEFIWLDNFSSNQNLFIFCSNKENGSAYSLLIKEEGTPVAYMSGIDFAETNVKLIEGMIHQQAAALPQLWEEIWKPQAGPMQKRINLNKVDSPSEEMTKGFREKGNEISEEEIEYYSMICHRSKLYVINGLYKLGWSPRVGESFTVQSVMGSVSILPKFDKYLSYFFNVAADFNYLKRSPDGKSFTATKDLPSSVEIESLLQKPEKPLFMERIEYRLIREIGNHMSEFFTGKAEVLNHIFPSDSSKPHAQELYFKLGNHAFETILEVNIKYVIPHLLENIEKSKASSKTGEHPVIRILEVGGGTGSFSKQFLEGFSDRKMEIEYTFTDISAAFFGPAEKMFEEHLQYIKFKKFNMEEDTFQQGLVPEYFDLILACEVLHVAKEIKPVLQNLRKLLKPNGILEVYETTRPCPRITFIFGLLEGYWQFQDHELRPNHITLSPDKWERLLKLSGFDKVELFPVYNNVHSFILGQASDRSLEQFPRQKHISGSETFSWIIFCDKGSIPLADGFTRKLESINRRVTKVYRPVEMTEESTKTLMENTLATDSEGGKNLEGVIYLWALCNKPGNRDQSQISLPFVTLCQNVLAKEKQPKVFVFTQGIHCVNGSDVEDPTAGTLVGIVRSIRNEQLSTKICLVDLSPNESVMDQAEEAFYNLWADNDGSIAFTGGKRLSPKITTWRAPNESLSLPNGCDRFKLVLPQSRMISDLEFGYLDPYVLEEKEVEVKVNAMALNFRDVFCVLKPLPIFEEMNSVGLDFAGAVVRVGKKVTKVMVGDRVIGMNMTNNLSLPSHMKTEENMVAILPSDMTFSEGVTLPAVFSTAVYCLINIAKMKRGDTVLIHTASGGVGLCAIQLAQKIGANIIATAGSTRKRRYLQKLGIEHVFNSRTTDFGDQILEVTNGRGVDIVLNSITGPGFKEASLKALAKNGRFVEMSKLNVWEEKDVKELRSDVTYNLVDLTTLEHPEYKELFLDLKKYLDEGSIKPIAFERFDALNIRGALNYLQKAKHIGKIVCVMPEVKIEKSKLTVFTPLFNDDSTYLITGGLGGIGLEVVKWMLENGAKHIAIASRSSPKPETAQLIDKWNKSGKHVEAFQVDVGNYDQCKQLFEQFNNPESKYPRIRGVMHAAGVLQDCSLDNMNWDKFLLTYNPKVKGSWNLHDLTKDLLLEHFVLFSSVAACFGSPGQSNHCASNSFEDTLCHYRKSIGLPAISVNWGNWGEVGVATEIDFPGVRPISTNQGLLALETFLKTQSSHIVVLNVDSFAMLAKLMVGVKSYVGDKRLLGETKIHVAMNADEFWAEVDSLDSKKGKLEVFKHFIKSTVRITLKMEEDEPIDDNVEFQVLGVDSLMMLEMRNALQKVLGTRMALTVAQLKDCNNSMVLANRLVNIFEGDSDADVVLPTEEELKALVREDSILPESVAVSEDLLPVKNVSEIETILLTGVIGNLGPYLLRDLSQRPQIKKIYCLIRKTGKVTASDRLHSRLTKTKLLDEIEMDKVECLQGDIADLRLGLSQEEYIKLASEIDAICHSAVIADHTAKYWKAPASNKYNIRTVNVLGTIHLLEFATTSTLKPIYYASTLIAVLSLDQEGSVSEQWEDVGAFDDMLKSNPGYPVSKFVAEQLIKEAGQRGVPIKTFRLPVITGDSETGRNDFESNHLVLRWLTYMKLGCMPDMPTPLPLLPVDHCSKLSLDIFFNPMAPWHAYNVSFRGKREEQDLIQVANDFGVKIEPVPYSQFIEKLKLDKDSPLRHFKSIYEDESFNFFQNFETNGKLSSYIIAFLENSHDFFKSRKILELYPNYEEKLESNSVVMKRDLQYLKDLGIFRKFGIPE